MYRMCEDAMPPLPDRGLSDLCRAFLSQCWQKNWRLVRRTPVDRLGVALTAGFV
jgi:hypothetical protein